MLGEFHTLFGGRRAEESGPVDFGPRGPKPRTRWPFHIDVVALDAVVRIPLPFEGPGKHGLAAALANGSQLDEGRCADDSDLFGELPARRIERAFTRLDFALGDRPDTVIPMREPRPTRMRNEDLQCTASEAVHEKAGADAGWTHDGMRTLDRPPPEAPPTGGNGSNQQRPSAYVIPRRTATSPLNLPRTAS